ncbi:HNH endonuclease signature motif containing protein [Serratia fonticola]
MSYKYTETQLLFLESICHGNTLKEITQIFNNRFNTKKTSMAIQHKLREMNIHKSVRLESQYTEAQLTFLYLNKALTWSALTEAFNNKFSENKTVSAIRVKMAQNGWGKYKTTTRKSIRRIYIDGVQVPLDRYVWECVNGPLPPGYTVIHLDDDEKNNQIANLRAAPSHTKAMFVLSGGGNAPKALAPALYAKVMLQGAIRKIEKGSRQ